MDNPNRWHIALTEPQRERTATVNLMAWGYEVYCPTFRKVAGSGGGGAKRQVDRPLFPGYLFVRESPDGWTSLRHASGIRQVHSLLMINGDYAMLPEDEVLAVRAVEDRLMYQWLNPDARVPRLHVGDRVQVTEGALTGRYARIETLDDDERIGLLMSIFGREARVFASPEQLAAI